MTRVFTPEHRAAISAAKLGRSRPAFTDAHKDALSAAQGGSAAKTFYTYLHRRVDTNEVFYVGKGAGSRAHSKTRGKWWKAVVAKAGGRTVQILAHWPTEAEAFEHEKFLIACFRDLGAPLCNISDGGQGGCAGVVKGPPTAETRARISASKAGVKRGPHSPETRAKIAAANARRVWTDSSRAKNSAARKGKSTGPRPPEVGRKISDALKGRACPDAVKAKIRATLLQRGKGPPHEHDMARTDEPPEA